MIFKLRHVQFDSSNIPLIVCSFGVTALSESSSAGASGISLANAKVVIARPMIMKDMTLIIDQITSHKNLMLFKNHY